MNTAVDGSGTAINLELLARSTQKHICVSEGLRQLLKERHRLGNAEAVPSGTSAIPIVLAAEKDLGIPFFAASLEISTRMTRQGFGSRGAASEGGCRSSDHHCGGGPPSRTTEGPLRSTPVIRILGRVSDDKKLQAVSTHRTLCLPSEREGFSSHASPRRWHVESPHHHD